MTRTRVLLNWDTTRKDLMEPFLRLKDELDITVVWGIPTEEEKASHPFRQVSFVDYKSAYEMLDDTRPDCILFFNINNFPQVALNMAAKNRKITTYTMHHGIHHADFLEITRALISRGGHKKRKLLSSFQSFRFYFSGLRFKNIGEIIPMIRFAWRRQRNQRLLAMEKSNFPSRHPDFYINLSPHNAIITKKIDHLTDDSRFRYIGHPFFDSILQDLNRLKSSPAGNRQPYWLLIDFANRDHVLSFKIMGAAGKKAFYQRLSALAKEMGCRLRIKLHPFGYDSPHNYVDDNIDLVKEANMAEEIHYAEKCFSFFSTLIIPVIYHKGSCFLFHIGEDRELQKDLVELGVAIRLETGSFEKDQIANAEAKVSEESYNEFVRRYLYYTDGKSTERLKNVLAGL